VAPAIPTPVIPTQVFSGTPVRQIFYPQQCMDATQLASNIGETLAQYLHIGVKVANIAILIQYCTNIAI